MTIARRDHAFHTLFIRTPLSHTEPLRLQQSPILLVFLVGFLLFSLGACAAGTSSTTVPPQSTAPATGHPSPTPTPLPAGIVLYQADWSHGLAGWQGTQGWKVVQGQLETDSGGSATLIIPYQPPVGDYAAHPASLVSLDPSDDVAPGSGLPIAYFPRPGWHIYGVEVRGNEARLLVDGIQVGNSARSERAKVLSNGPLGLSSESLVLRVSSIRILTV